MYSNRKSSVKRHITNQHNGAASLVSFIEYVVGRTSGLYSPPEPPLQQAPLPPPSFNRHKQSENQKRENSTAVEIFEEEFLKEKARLAARKDTGMNLFF